MPVTVVLTIDCEAVPVDEARLRAAVRRVFADAGINSGRVGVAVLSDAEIRKLNNQYLRHDYATDALSFVLSRTPERVEGEIAVGAETALREAEHYGWPAADELLLYVVHGALHLVGGDDTTPAGAIAMRRREREVLGAFGLVPPWDEADEDSGHTDSGHEAAQAARQEGSAR